MQAKWQENAGASHNVAATRCAAGLQAFGHAAVEVGFERLPQLFLSSPPGCITGERGSGVLSFGNKEPPIA